MARRITAEDLNRYSVKELEKYIYRTAKKANLDLRALEREGYASGSRAYKYVKALSFDGDIVGVNKNGEIYFRTRHDTQSRAKLLHIASEIAGFKGAATHTSKGVQRAYSKAYNTYLNKRAEEIAGEREGTIAPSRAGVLKAKRELEGRTDKNWFNNQWGRLGKEAYKRAKMMSETVAQLFEQSFSARQVVRAMNRIGDEQPLSEYVNSIRGGRAYLTDTTDDYNPFIED